MPLFTSFRPGTGGGGGGVMQTLVANAGLVTTFGEYYVDNFYVYVYLNGGVQKIALIPN